MKHFASLLALMPLLLAASDSSGLYRLYQNGQYIQACNAGVKELQRHQDDERFVSLYAFACLEADRIDRLALPIVMLKNSPEARKNATYFTAILLQKNLLLNALEERAPITGLNLPTSDHLLSRVFDLYSANKFVRNGDTYVFSDPKNARRSYQLFLQRTGRSLNLGITEYYDTILTKQHIYR
ncbi:hypothetical protein WCX49_03445 [Sulfurimonas sp. HSL-1656]|uniref:hypothetical protein n=1 Tax=Thiomicrolovo subterrani TaxID=3131934 RepID=UPI0031F97D7E